LWIASADPAERARSSREFALKLRDRLASMRTSVSAVFLGPATGRGLFTRSRLRDELEKSGCRVLPDADYLYQDLKEVQTYLRASLLAAHFPGDGLDLEGLLAIEESFRSAGKTLLVQPFGSSLSIEESELLAEIETQLTGGGRFSGVQHTRLEGKTDDQVWEVVKREVRAARFRRTRNEYKVGIACEARDLAGAKSLAGLIKLTSLDSRHSTRRLILQAVRRRN
jgi:hypothetical protein